MTHKGLVEPHILLASSNPKKLVRNLQNIISVQSIRRIEEAVEGEVRLLFQLGISHYDFSLTVDARHWRQKISRLYYGAYNVKRAIVLINDGSFSTESNDHAKVDGLPNTLNNHATHAVMLKNMRDDRNLADYSHLARESDLISTVADAERKVSEFIADSKGFLAGRGVTL